MWRLIGALRRHRAAIRIQALTRQRAARRALANLRDMAGTRTPKETIAMRVRGAARRWLALRKVAWLRRSAKELRASLTLQAAARGWQARRISRALLADRAKVLAAQKEAERAKQEAEREAERVKEEAKKEAERVQAEAQRIKVEMASKEAKLTEEKETALFAMAAKEAELDDQKAEKNRAVNLLAQKEAELEELRKKVKDSEDRKDEIRVQAERDAQVKLAKERFELEEKRRQLDARMGTPSKCHREAGVQSESKVARENQCQTSRVYEQDVQEKKRKSDTELGDAKRPRSADGSPNTESLSSVAADLGMPKSRKRSSEEGAPAAKRYRTPGKTAFDEGKELLLRSGRRGSLASDFGDGAGDADTSIGDRTATLPENEEFHLTHTPDDGYKTADSHFAQSPVAYESEEPSTEDTVTREDTTTRDATSSEFDEAYTNGEDIAKTRQAQKDALQTSAKKTQELFNRYAESTAKKKQKSARKVDEKMAADEDDVAPRRLFPEPDSTTASESMTASDSSAVAKPRRDQRRASLLPTASLHPREGPHLHNRPVMDGSKLQMPKATCKPGAQTKMPKRRESCLVPGLVSYDRSIPKAPASKH
jgi:hypothetical protein